MISQLSVHHQGFEKRGQSGKGEHWRQVRSVRFMGRDMLILGRWGNI